MAQPITVKNYWSNMLKLSDFAYISFNMQLRILGKQFAEIVQNKIKNSRKLSELMEK